PRRPPHFPPPAPLPGSSTMHPTVALLVSHRPALVEQVKRITRGLPHLQVELCPPASACERARQPDVGLILAHPEGAEEAATTRLLRSVAEARRVCPTVVLCEAHQEDLAHGLLRHGAADFVTLPGELTRLRYLLEVLTQRHRSHRLPGPARSALPD